MLPAQSIESSVITFRYQIGYCKTHIVQDILRSLYVVNHISGHYRQIRSQIISSKSFEGCQEIIRPILGTCLMAIHCHTF